MGFFRKKSTTIFLLITTLFITGCTVSPEPLTKDEIALKANQDLKLINRISPIITEPITIDEAINKALKNNVRNKIKLMQTALAKQQIDLVYYDMLPNLTTSAGYSKRDEYAASASTSFSNGNPEPIIGTPSYSVSQDKEKIDADISFSWNILDFGLSYVKAQQQADKYLMAKQNERKVIHNIVQEVRRTYYKAASAQALLKKIVPMMKDVQTALDDSNKIKKLRINSPMQSLAYQRDLLEVLRSLQTLERSLMNAKVELAELMGLKAGTHFTIAQEIKNDYELPKLNLGLKEMEVMALENRPEILESRYQQRISHKETTRAILQMLPGIKLNSSISYDNNDYLLNNNWTSYGATISWNLLNIFKASTSQKLAKTKIAIAKEQKLAISMAVLSQVHLSLADFEQSKKEYMLSKKYLDVAQEIYKLTEVTNRLDMNSRLVYIKEKLNYILALLRHSSSYANVQNSYGRVFASIGTYEDIGKETIEKNSILKEQKPKKQEIKEVKAETKKRVENLIKTAQTTQNVYLRKEPNKDSEFSVVLLKDRKIKVLREFENKFGKWVETPLGFIYKSAVFIKDEVKNKDLILTNKMDSKKSIFKAVAFKHANIRTQPNWQSPTVFLLPKDKKINISEIVSTKKDIWYKTSFGYVSNLVMDIEE